MTTGRLLGIGVGPGDPELMTLKAVRLLRAAQVVSYVSANGQPSIARRIAAVHLPGTQREINLALPMLPLPELAEAAYDEGASRIGAELEQGRDVAVLCEGDPLFYGSFTHLLARLAGQYPTEIVPGVVSFTAAAAAARQPLVARAESFLVVPATLPADQLRMRLGQFEAAAILKLGRHLAKVRRVLRRARPARARDLRRVGEHRAGAGPAPDRSRRQRGALLRADPAAAGPRP